MEKINYATYLERLQNVRRTLQTLECMCLIGNVGEPIVEGDADSALAEYAMIAIQTVDALAECGNSMISARHLVAKQRCPSKIAGQKEPRQ